MKRILYATLVLCQLSLRANAQTPLLYEPFAYAADATNGLSRQSGGAWSVLNTGDSILVTANSLTYAGLIAPQGNKVNFGGTGTDYVRPFAAQTTGTVYYSFLLSVADLGTLNATGGYFAALTASGTNFGATVWLRLAATGGYNIGIAPRTRTTLPDIPWTTTAYPINQPVLVVATYQFVAGDFNDQVRLWVNPTDLGGAEPAGALTAVNATGGLVDLTSVERILLRQDNATATPAVMSIDELRVGTTWASVTPAAAPVTTPALVTTATLTPFSTAVGTPSAAQSYSVSGSNLTGDVTITAPVGFAIRLAGGTFGSTLTLTPTAGTLASTTVEVRLTGAAAGSVSGNLAHASAGAATQNVALSGTVSGGGPPTITSIAQARALAAGTQNVTIAGRVTASGQFGNPVYMQDVTGGIPIFFTTRATFDNFVATVAIGDSVTVTANVAAFQQQVQLDGANATFQKVGTTNAPVTPRTVAITELLANEGRLVTVNGVEFVNKDFVLLPNNNQAVRTGTDQADVRIDADTDLPGVLKPQAPTSVTGVVGRFGANAQLLPRFRADVPGVQPYTDPTASVPKDQTFDVVTWNVEWFGSTTLENGQPLGPADKALQLQNVQRVLRDLDADVYALQEVSDTVALRNLVSGLPGYAFRFSTFVSNPTTPGDKQRPTFIYKTATVRPVATRGLLTGVNPATLTDYPDPDRTRFWASGRLPFLLVADVTIGGVTKRLNLVNIHARANATGANQTLNYRMRQYDLKVLKDTLDAQFTLTNLVLLGDYNDDVTRSVVPNQPSTYQNFVTDTDRYFVLTRSLSDRNFSSFIGSSFSFFDHLTASTRFSPDYLANSVRVETPFVTTRNYVNTTSDHLPVSARFRLQPTVPTLFLTGMFVRFSARALEPSPVQTYSLAAADLTDSLVIIAPDRFEIRRAGQTNFSRRIAIAPVNGSIATTAIEVRLAASRTDLLVAGELVHTSAGLATRRVNIEGIAAVVTSAAGALTDQLTVFPNPTTGTIRLRVEGAAWRGNQVEMAVVAADGRVLATARGDLATVTEVANAQLTTARAGLYVLQLRNGNARTIARIVKY